MSEGLPLVTLCSTQEIEPRTISVEEAIDYVTKQVSYLPTERFVSIQCKNGEAVNYTILHIGTPSTVDMLSNLDDLARILLFSDADEVVFIHTHPNLEATPSPPDLANFHTLNVFLSLLNIKVYDMLVLSDFGEGTEIKKYSIREKMPNFLNLPEQKEDIQLYDKKLEKQRKAFINDVIVF